MSHDLVQSEGDGLLELPDVQGLEALGKHRYRVALDAGITPRQVSQGTSLEDHFLQVTGPGSDDSGRSTLPSPHLETAP